MKIHILILLGLAALSLAQNYSNCTGHPNTHPLITAKPTLQATTKNGKRFFIRDPENPLIHINVAVLYGTAYDMGYAMGTMFKSEVHEFVQSTLAFIYGTEFEWAKVIPDWMKITNYTDTQRLGLGLNLEQIATFHDTPQRFLDELKGISDASGVDYNALVHVNLFPELTRAICSIFGAWGPATADGNLLHLRALDYVAEAPFNNLATVTIYHPSEEGSQHFANFGWVGMIGSLAGYNGLVGIGERAWANTQDTTSTIFGEPWMFVVRDVVQFGYDLPSAISVLENANRTYNIRLGLGAKKDNQFRGIEYTHPYMTFYTDQNYSDPFSPIHPQMDGIMYWYRSGDPCFTQTIEANYGNITAETIWRNMAARGTTGNTMVAVYDYARNDVYISMASNYMVAYNNPSFYLNMTYWFSVTPNSTDFEDEMEDGSVKDLEYDSDEIFEYIDI